VDYGLRCADEFAADARLLRGGVPAVRVVTFGETAISYGVGVHDDAPYLRRARAAGIATVRRSSGGTGVLHLPGDLAWSVVLPRDDPHVGRDFVHAYPRLGAGVVRWLRAHRVDGRWTSPPPLANDLCVLSGRGQVLSVGGRSLGGAAQHLTRTALLHQGMVAIDLDRARIGEIFELSSEMLSERLIALRELAVRDPPEGMARELAAELARDFVRASP
jgi:lipoate-protein ligase A